MFFGCHDNVNFEPHAHIVLSIVRSDMDYKLLMLILLQVFNGFNQVFIIHNLNEIVNLQNCSLSLSHCFFENDVLCKFKTV